MLDPNLLRNEPDAVAEKLARRGFKLDVDKLGALEERRSTFLSIFRTQTTFRAA